MLGFSHILDKYVSFKDLQAVSIEANPKQPKNKKNSSFEEMKISIQSPKLIFYEALSLLIAITFDPSRYNFKIREDESPYKNICGKSFKMLEDHFMQDMDIKIFNSLKELIQNCPQKMFDLLESMCK